MASSYQHRRAIIITASLAWLIKNQFHWDDLTLSLMGDAGSVILVLSAHLQGKGTCLECRFPQNWKLLEMVGVFWSHLLLGRHTAGVSSSRWPWHPADFPQPNIFWIDLGVLCLGFCCDGVVWWVFFVSFPSGKLQTRHFLQNLHWFCQYFTRKSFFPWELGRNQDLRASQSAQTHCQCRGWDGAGNDRNLQ